MIKIFCDNCGAECVNLINHVRVSTEHQTNQRENLGIDESGEGQLCETCAAPLKKMLERVIRRHERDIDMMPVELPVRAIEYDATGIPR